MNSKTQTPVNTTTKPSLNADKSGLLQRKCACGNSAAGLTGECATCQTEKLILQRKQTAAQDKVAEVPPIAHEALSLPRVPFIQAKLTIGASDDPLEREADRVADQVMAAPTHPAVSDAPPRIQRFTEQPTGNTDMAAPASVDRVLSSPGRPLEPGLQQDMGQRFGHDFSQVRIHTDAAAARSAREVNANAYTVGHNIVFGAGRFIPGTHKGRRLIAHELTHVVQQSGSDVTCVDQCNEKGDLFPISPLHNLGEVLTLQREGGSPSSLPVPELPKKVIPGSTPLSREVQAYRIANPNLPEGTNLVGVEFSTSGNDKPQIKVFENRPGVAHSEEVMDQFFRDLRRTTRQQSKVLKIYSERQPCGPSEHDCEGLLLKSEKYKTAEKTFGYDYQDANSRVLGEGPYRAGQTKGRIQESHERLNETKNLEWDFQKKPTQPYHERKGTPSRESGGNPPASGEGMPTRKSPAPAGEAVSTAAVTKGVVGKEAGSGSLAGRIGGAALSFVAEQVVLLAVNAALQWALAKLFELQLENDITNILKPQVINKLGQLESKIAALQGTRKLFIRITYDYIFQRDSPNGDPVVQFMQPAPPFYEWGSVRLVNIHPGNEELDFPSESSEKDKEFLPPGKNRERVTVRSGYSLLLDDAPKRAREKENTTLIEKLRKAAPKTLPSQSPPSQPTQTPPLLPSLGTMPATPSFDPLPGAPGPSPMAEVEVRVAFFKTQALNLLARGEKLLSSSAERSEIDRFEHDEGIWRDLVTLWKNNYTDKGPDFGRAQMDELLNSDQYGGRLKQIRQNFGG